MTVTAHMGQNDRPAVWPTLQITPLFLCNIDLDAHPTYPPASGNNYLATNLTIKDNHCWGSPFSAQIFFQRVIVKEWYNSLGTGVGTAVSYS